MIKCHLEKNMKNAVETLGAQKGYRDFGDSYPQNRGLHSKENEE